MRKNLLLFSVLLVMGMAASAQKAPDLSAYKTQPAKIKRLVEICDSLALHELQEPLHAAALYGIRITPPKDLKRLAYFYYRLGAALETTSRSDSFFLMQEKALEYAKKARDTRQTVLSLDRLLFMYNNVAGSKAKSIKWSCILPSRTITPPGASMKNRYGTCSKPLNSRKDSSQKGRWKTGNMWCPV